MKKASLILIALFLSYAMVIGQTAGETEPMRIIHCTAIDQGSEVVNIFVDDNNNKWVATTDALYQIYSADNAGKEDGSFGDWTLLRKKDGNAPLVFEQNEALKKMNIEKGKNEINTTFYDKKRKQLWVGTTNSGAYCYKVGREEIRLQKSYNTSNSKLLSNRINTIFVDKYGREWLGSDAGVLTSSDDKWKLYEKESKIFSIVPDKVNVWIMGDTHLWKVDDIDRWMLDQMDARLSRGQIREISYDNEGKLWVASDIITRFDVLNDIVEVYDRSAGFTAKQINCIKVDKEDALWVGTQDQGLFLIDKESTMTISCVVDKALSCTGTTDDASLLVKVFGGTPPYTYQWNTPSFMDNNPQGVGPGLFTVIVSDANGITKKASAKIEDNRMRVEVGSTVDASPGKSDGKAKIEVSGGVPSYQYKWDNGETNSKAKRLAAGKHEVTVSDKAGCEYVAMVDIGGVALAQTNSSKSALNINFDLSENLKCATDKNASISVSVDGGNAPYTYEWNKSGMEGNVVNNVGPGEYKLKVTDASGKTSSQTFYVDAPDPLRATARMDQPVTGERKRDGIAIATATGGTGNYKYEWDNGILNSKAKKMTMGKHSVTVTDDNGCTTVANINMTKRINSALASSNFKKGQTIRLDKLYFDADSTQITSISEPTLNEIVKFMKNNPKVKVEIGGHTNDIPEHEFCDKLSTARAKSVVEYIQAKGVSANRLSYKGYGKRKPVASNRTSAGRQKNQRVEMKILETGA